MDPLKNLETRVSSLGNYFLKYLHTIRQHHTQLIKSLDSAEKLTQIHLWQSSFSPQEEMQVICSMPDDLDIRVHNLSCYYALQYIHTIFRNLDILEMGTTAGITSNDVYYKFMMQFGQDFRVLSKYGDLTQSGINRITEIYRCHL